MVLTYDEIARSLRGVWLIFCGRPDGLSALDRSVDGFWRSFAVILLLLPVNALTMFAASRAEGASGTFVELFFSGLPVLVLDWIAFPLALAFAAGPLAVRQTYASYVVARNWAAPLAAVVMMVPFLLQGAGWLATPAAVLLSLIALLVVLRFHYVILRVALKTTVGVSAALVGADFMLTLVIVALFD